MLSQSELGTHVGISRQAVAGLIAEEIIDLSLGLDACRLAYIQRLREQAAGRLGRDEDIDPATEKALLDRARRELVTHQLREREGRLVDAEEVAERWERITRSIRDRFLGLPSKVAKRLANLPAPEVYAALDREVREILVNLASGAKPNRAARRAVRKGR